MSNRFLKVIILIVFVVNAIFFQGCKIQPRSRSYDVKIERALGHYLYFENGVAVKTVSLLGVYIPLPWDENYHEDLQANIRQLVEGKNVEIETVVEAHSWGYPKYDQVKVYIKGENLNRYLLKEGMAFFNEDYWDKEEKNEYRELESVAKKNMKGIWRYTDQLKIISVRRKDWQYTHAPGCPHVKDVPDAELIKYYFPLSFQKEAIVEEVTCEFSMKIWHKQEEERKVRKENYKMT